jgi:hypothetical protein
MTWAPDYASLSDLKAFVGGIDDTDDDVSLQAALSGASRAIDGFAGRQFGVLSAAAPRYYSGRWDSTSCRWVVDIDDLMSTTNLLVKTDPSVEGTFDNTLTIDTDFRLAPFNAAADGRPWTAIIAGSGVNLSGRLRSVQVTALWGWTAVPSQIKTAALIQAARLFKRKDSPFGIAGSPEMGSEMRLLDRLDPDVKVLVQPLRRYWGAV